MIQNKRVDMSEKMSQKRYSITKLNSDKLAITISLKVACLILI